jgi:glucosamine kinase
MRRIGLGIDIGGTETRWHLLNEEGSCIAEGLCPSLAGIVRDKKHEIETSEILNKLIEDVQRHAEPTHVVAGITGYSGCATGERVDVFHSTLTKALPKARLLLISDVLMSYFCAFEPGQGYLAYAGTGSMSAYVDEKFQLHRAGGRGFVIDDAGGGFWMAKEALRRIWHERDKNPDSHLDSPLAMAMFATMGGSDWNHTRQFVYTRQRGEIGKLAIHLSACVDSDPIARQVVEDAGRELARLILVHINRHGNKPVVVTGRASQIHPLYLQSIKSQLPAVVELRPTALNAQFHAARIAVSATENFWQGIQFASSTN